MVIIMLYYAGGLRYMLHLNLLIYHLLRV